MSSAIGWIRSEVCHLSGASLESPTKQRASIVCDAPKTPIPITLKLQIQYDSTAGPFSWGLYHIDSATTIYQQSLGEDDEPPGEMQQLFAGEERPPPTAKARVNNSVQAENIDDTTVRISLTFSDLAAGTYAFQIRDPTETAIQFVKLSEELLPADGTTLAEEVALVTLQGSFGGFHSSYFVTEQQYYDPSVVPPAENSLGVGEVFSDTGTIETTTPDFNATNSSMLLGPIGPMDRFESVNMTAAPKTNRSLTVEIRYDEAASETSWILSSRDSSSIATTTSISEPGTNSRIVYVSPFLPQSSNKNLRLMSTTVMVEAPGIYDFQMWDSGKNGLGGQHKTGWISLWVGNTLVYKSSGDFGASLSETIVLK